ncbi:hypothetical protein OAA43_00605 [bacterium]|jgi:hypothetical protein|nr:hypothetical protein [bacterium]|tara:strand:+ start:1454 stop:1912 length:459 start_codon:yes stop_codon:yes gene_type:complete
MVNIFNNIHKGILSLNSNKFFAGIVMLILNLGSKFITIKFSASQEAYLRNSVGRQLLIFAIAWIGTKDIYYSLAITAIFVVLADYLFNEDSDWCVLSDNFKALKSEIDLNGDGIISDDELNKAIKTLQSYKKNQLHKAQKNAYQKFKKDAWI